MMIDITFKFNIKDIFYLKLSQSFHLFKHCVWNVFHCIEIIFKAQVIIKVVQSRNLK